MFDWDEVSRTEDEEQLRKVKLWLFQENIRLEEERRELSLARENLVNERIRFEKEMEELKRRTAMERKRLKEDNLFFDKKMVILQDGFRKLEEDRQLFNRQKKAFLAEQKSFRLYGSASGGGPGMEEVVRTLFRGTTNPLALRKRYRDLVKIFHPDNLFGDAELAQMINREYIRRKREE